MDVPKFCVFPELSDIPMIAGELYSYFINKVQKNTCLRFSVKNLRTVILVIEAVSRWLIFTHLWAKMQKYIESTIRILA